MSIKQLVIFEERRNHEQSQSKVAIKGFRSTIIISSQSQKSGEIDILQKIPDDILDNNNLIHLVIKRESIDVTNSQLKIINSFDINVNEKKYEYSYRFTLRQKNSLFEKN